VQRVKALETELQQMNDNFAQQSEAKDDMLRSLQGSVCHKGFLNRQIKLRCGRTNMNNWPSFIPNFVKNISSFSANSNLCN